MSQVLTVPTQFNDIGELSEAFLDRVEQDTLILYGPIAYEDGSDIEFSILLADGTPALEGVGQVRAAVDGGEDRMPETRYDVVVEALEFAGRYEVVFERLVLDRQGLSEPPSDEVDEGPTGETETAPADDDPEVEAVDLSNDEVLSLAPLDDSEAEMVLEAADEEVSDAYVETGRDLDESTDADTDTDTAADAATVADAVAEMVAAGAPQIHRSDAPLDPQYAFEHGIAMEPKVGMPVPIPSMAAPPEAPPAPPTLRLAEPPQGLTRPSMAQPEDSLFSDEEVSDVHTTGLFAYEDALPIPSRPPLPDPNGAERAAGVEAVGDYDVEESEPPEAHDDEYEEVRLSDFAEEG